MCSFACCINIHRKDIFSDGIPAIVCDKNWKSFPLSHAVRFVKLKHSLTKFCFVEKTVVICFRVGDAIIVRAIPFIERLYFVRFTTDGKLITNIN